MSSLAQKDTGTGYLSVASESNLNIYIDTTYIASHSFSYLSLDPGRYTLYAYETNNLEWNPQSIKKQIEIIKGEHLQIDLSALESVRI